MATPHELCHRRWSLLVGCLTSQQQASVSQGRICSDNFTCCHTEIEVADPTFYLTQSQYTDTGPTSPSADPITPGTWQGNRRWRTVAHAACTTHKTNCLRTNHTMAEQLSLERRGVVLLDRSRGGTAPGSQPQRSPAVANDCDSDPSGLTMDGQSRANGQHALKVAQ